VALVGSERELEELEEELEKLGGPKPTG